MDVLFINPDSSSKAYQGLAKVYSAIEPPTWALLLAESCRSKGFACSILDCDAERQTLEQSVRRVDELRPRLVVFVVYGQNPNSGTTSMIGALAMASTLKDHHPEFPICFVGSHTSALPKEVLAYDCVDIVLLNEGVYALHNLLKSNLGTDLQHIKGIGYKKHGPGSSKIPTITPPSLLCLRIEWIMIYRAMHGTCCLTAKSHSISIAHISGTRNLTIRRGRLLPLFTPH